MLTVNPGDIENAQLSERVDTPISKARQLGLWGQEFSLPSKGNPTFRPIHYLGSKLRIVEVIIDAIDEVDPACGPVCDLFAGSGTVSLALSQKRDVSAVDIQEYSRVLCSALLEPRGLDDTPASTILSNARSSARNLELTWAISPLIAHEKKCLEEAYIDPRPLFDVIEHGSILAFEQGLSEAQDPTLRSVLKQSVARLGKVGLQKDEASLVTRYFGGIYFSYSQAVHLDALLEYAHAAPPSARDSLLAVVLSTASETVNTVGKQFAQPLRPRNADGTPKKHLVGKSIRDRAADVYAVFMSWHERYQSLRRTERQHRVVRADYVDALDQLDPKIKVVYADPPYTRDHYSRFYHVLETMCLRDNPDVSTVKKSEKVSLSRGIYRTTRHQSAFCIKSQAPGAFEKLFSKVRAIDASLVLSYSPYQADSSARPRLMTIEAVSTLAKNYFRHVRTISAGQIAHSKLNVSELNAGIPNQAEVLFLCKL